MVFTGNNDVEIDVRIRTDQAKEGFRQVETGLKGVEQEARKASSVLEDFSRGIVQGIGIGAATTAIAGLSNAFSSLPAAIERGAFVNDISESFQNLATAAGVSSDALINKFSSALGDTIPKVDAMKQANELLLGGLDPSQFDLVAQAARAFADVTGTDATQGMNALTDSLLRGNDKALKNLGIVIDNEKAYKEYAKSIGATGKELSEEGKVLATREAVLRAVSEKMKELGVVTNDAGDNINKLKSAFQNQIDKAAESIATNETLNLALDKLATTAANLDFTPIINGLTSIIELAVGAAEALLKTAAAAAEAFDTRSEAVKKADSIEQSYLKTQKEFQKLNDAMSSAKSVQELEKLKGSFKSLGESISKVSDKKQKDFFEGAFVELNKNANELAKSLPKVGAAATKAGKDISGLLAGDKGAADKALKLKEAAEKLREELNSTSGIVKYRGEVEKIAAAYRDGITELETYNNDMAKLRESYLKGGGAAENLESIISGGLSDALEDGKKKLDEYGKEAQKALEDAARAAEEFNQSLGSIVAGGIGDLLRGDFEGALTGLGSGLGELFGKDIGKDLGDAIGGQFGEIGGAIGGSIGSFLGEKLGDAVLAGIDHIFGGRDAQGKVRDSLDKLFADALKDNPVQAIIGGQLQSISDLDFLRGTKDYVNGTFDDLFQSLPDKAKAGFEGVAAGFTEIFGQGSELSSQLAAVFANNLGGSLNNLQLLVEATGKSFEDLKKGVVEAFLDGKLSALEAQTALNGIAQVSQKGIPDGIGMVAEAFDNLKNAGTKGGRALIDALQDIGFEAKELGDKTLEQVMQRLKATGKFSAAEIEQVFSELKKNGIDSVDKLTKATNEQLIPVLSALQAGGFGFKEQAKEVKDYVDAINQIPDRKSVVIDLKVNASDKDKEVINNLPRNKSGQGINSETGR